MGVLPNDSKNIALMLTAYRDEAQALRHDSRALRIDAGELIAASRQLRQRCDEMARHRSEVLRRCLRRRG